MIKTLIWASEKDNIKSFGLETINDNVSFFFSDTKNTKFTTLIKQLKKEDCSKIIKINDDKKFELIFKRNSVWTSIKFEELVSYWMYVKKYSTSNNDFWVPKELKSGKNKSNLIFPFEINDENIVDYIPALNFFCEENSLKEVNDKVAGHSLKLSNKFIKTSEANFNEFGNKISNGNLQGIQKNRATFEDDKITLETKFGNVYLIKENDGVRLISFLKAEQNNSAELSSFAKGEIFNIESHLIKREVTTNVPKKIGIKNLITWIVSLVVIAILLYATFNFIFTPHNSKTALEIIFSKYTWGHPWIYLMFFNFLISIFYGPIIGIIFFKIAKPKQKIVWSTYVQFFVAGQVRLVTVFLTGNSILATFFWAWYMTSATKIKTIGIVGMVASMNIVRGVLIVPIGALFMIRGSFFNAQILNELGMQSEMIAIITLSWIGWIWHIIHSLSISLLIIMPPLHILYNKILLIQYGRKSNSDHIINKMTDFETNLIQLKKSFKGIFKNKERFYRITIIIVLNILIETFEFTFGLRMVEDYAINVTGVSGLVAANYWNVFAISSVRYMSGYIYHVPILNLLPGQGTGITDLTLKISTQGVIYHAHGSWSADNINIINDMGEQTTFVMRFFNFYLRRMIALVITTIFVSIAIIKRRGR